MTYKPCYHRGGTNECKSGHACPYAPVFWMARATMAEEAHAVLITELRGLAGTVGSITRRQQIEAIISRAVERAVKPVPGDSAAGLPRITSAGHPSKREA